VSVAVVGGSLLAGVSGSEKPMEQHDRASNSGRLWRKVMSAAVLLPPVLWVVWRGGMPFAIAASLVAGTSTLEFQRLATGTLQPIVWPAVVGAALLPLLPVVTPRPWEVSMVVLMAVSIIGWSWSAIKGDVQEGALDAAIILAAARRSSSRTCYSRLARNPRRTDNTRAWPYGT
jgi:hypothetical protein